MASSRLFVAAMLAACGGDKAAPDAPNSGSDAVAVDAPSGTEATSVLARVWVTTLPRASPNAGVAGTFSDTELVPGDDPAPKLSNTVISSIPGTPAKPLF